MIKEFLKNKKRIGIVAILGIILIISGVVYSQYGFKELKKNDTESIFVDADKINIDDDVLKNKSIDDKGKSEDATIDLKNKDIVVEIKGEIKRPDVYTLDENSIVKDIIDKAGGLTENADLSNINRAKKLQNHELIYISNINDKNQNVNMSNNNTILSQGNSNGKININIATLDELKTLTGIGDAKAKKIIEYREQNGGFKSIDDMKNVSGIGDKMFEQIKEQIEI